MSETRLALSPDGVQFKGVPLTPSTLSQCGLAKSSFGGAEISQNYKYNKELNPYVNGLTKAAQKTFDQQYLSFFKIYRKYVDHIKRVTLWGVDDGSSWLNGWPVPGRTNYGLLIDRNYKVKPVVKEIIKLYE